MRSEGSIILKKIIVASFREADLRAEQLEKKAVKLQQEIKVWDKKNAELQDKLDAANKEMKDLADEMDVV